jgi:hypothetical protein
MILSPTAPMSPGKAGPGRYSLIEAGHCRRPAVALAGRRAAKTQSTG